MGVLLENRNSPAYPSIFYPLVRALFASRRKTIKNNLIVFIASHIGKTFSEKILSAGTSTQDLCAAIFAENGFTGMERAEDLEPEAFLSIANTIENMRK